MTETIEDNQQFVTFQLGEELFGVRVARTREILNLTSITKVPQTPGYMLGVINLRGQVVPVIDMRLKLGIPAGVQTQNTCILVMEIACEDDTLVVGALVDAVCEVLELNSENIEPAPRLGTKLDNKFIQGMGKVDEQFLILLDIDKVFNSDELIIMQDAG